MDDLISRAAAIEAIKPLLYSGNCVSTLINMPAVDAVPVEWLEKKRKEALREGMRPDEVDAVEMVLWMWQKEQEAST